MLVLIEVEGEEMTDWKSGRQAAALVQPRDREGRNQGKESGNCVGRHNAAARSFSISKLILNTLEGISEQRILQNLERMLQL